MVVSEYVNQYRTMKVELEHFPDWFDFSKYKVFGYMQGERVNKTDSLTLFNFDKVIFLHESKNAINNRNFLHCLGYRNDSKFLTSLVLQKIN